MFAYPTYRGGSFLLRTYVVYIAGGKSSSKSINSRQSGLSNTLKLFLSGLKYTDPRTTNLRFIFWKPCNCNPLARNLRLPSIHYPSLSILAHPPTIYYHLDISTSQHSVPNQHPLSPPSPPPPPANQPTNQPTFTSLKISFTYTPTNHFHDNAKSSTLLSLFALTT